jgi:hypothetical protein
MTTTTFAILDDICKFQRPETAASKRKWVSKPYWRRGHLYATDAAILARVQCDLADATAVYGECVSRKAVPPPCPYLEPAPGATYRDTPIKTAAYESLMKCGCSRRTRCGRCDDGETPIYRSVQILGHEPPIHYGAWYLAILARHGVTSLRIAEGRDCYRCPALFDGDGFDGLLMPIVFDGKTGGTNA